MTKSKLLQYEKVFMQSSSEALNEAVQYLLKKEKVKTLGDVAKKAHVSNYTTRNKKTS